jgi:type IV pilus assembly protein PilM
MANAAFGVTVGSHTIRALGVRRKGDAWAVTKVAAQRVDEEVRPQAGRWLVSRGVKGAPVTLGLTGRDVIIRYNQVPPVPDWRLKNLMKFEVEEVSGQSGGAVSADYRKLNLPDPEGTRGEDTVLVALARNAYLDPLLQSMTAGGLTVAGGCPSSIALFNAFAVNATYREDETCLLVNVGAQGMDLAIERGGELIFARNVSPGGKAITDAIASAFSTTEAKAEAMKVAKADVTPRGQARYPDPTSEKVANAIMGAAGQMASVVQSTLMICRAQTKLPDLKVDRVCLAGGGASLKGLDAYLKQAMGVPVERFDPFEGVDLSGLPEAEKALLDAAPHEFAVVLGLAQTTLAPAAFRLAVLPEGLRRRREFATKGIYSVLAGAVAASALVILYTSRNAASAEVARQRDVLKATDNAAKKLDEQFREVLKRRQEEREKTRRLAERAAPGVLMAETLALLESKLPSEVYLEDLVLEVADNARSYPLLHPSAAKGGKGGYTARDHTHSVRTAQVVVTAHVSAGTAPAKVYSDFVAALRANDRGLLVTPKETLKSDGRFKVVVSAFEAVPRKGAEDSEPWLLRDARWIESDPEGSETIRGTTVDGIVVDVPVKDVDEAAAKRLKESLRHEAAAMGGE